MRPRERAPEDRPFVFVNMVSTIDGRAQVRGRTGDLGEAADLEMLLELRALADAVLIGPGTLRAEGYGRLVGSEERRARRQAAGLSADPVAVVLSRGLDAAVGRGPVRGARAAGARLRRRGHRRRGRRRPPRPSSSCASRSRRPAAMLADLRARGIAALLSEGGPTLNSAMLAGRLVDELFLTIAPQITGEPDAIRIVEGEGLPEALRARPVWVLRARGELFLRYALQ